MRNSIYRITLDMHDVASQVQITAKQHDTARKLHITLSENGSPYTIEEGCRAVLAINRSGSTVIIDDCEIKLNGSVIMYDFNSQTTEVLGINECEVKLYDPDGDIITSPRFTLLVDENVYNDGEDHGIDHRNVLNRDKEDQHPIKAITGLEKELESKANAEKIYAEIALDRSRIDNIAALGQNSVIEVQKKYNTTGATTPLTFTLDNDGKCVVIIYYYKSAPNTETYSSSVLVNSQSIFTKTLDGAAGTYLEEVEFDGKAGDIVTITRDNVNVSINSVLYVTNKSTDTELADIRLGADGTIYPCAGDAVREQYSALKDDVDSQVGALKGDLVSKVGDVKTTETEIDITIENGGVGGNVGSIITVGDQAYWKHTVIDIEPYSTYRVTGHTMSNAGIVGYWYLTDDNGRIIRKDSTSTEEHILYDMIVKPINGETKLYVLSSSSDIHIYRITSINLQSQIDELTPDVAQNTEDIANVKSNIGTLPLSIVTDITYAEMSTTYQNGGVSGSVGSVANIGTQTYWFRWKVSVADCDSLKCCIRTMGNLNVNAHIYFIDENEVIVAKYIQGTETAEIKEIELPIPDGSKYVYILSSKADLTELYIKTLKLDSVANLVKSNKTAIETINNELHRIPKYYTNEWFNNIFSKIRESSNFVNGVVFAFITDLHFGANKLNSKYLLKEVLDNTVTPFVIFGGDYPMAYGAKETLDNDIETLMDYARYIGKDRFASIRGNHDFTIKFSRDSSEGYSMPYPNTYNAISRVSEHWVKHINTTHMCFYIENEAQKTRIICLNSSDGESKEDVGWSVPYRVSAEQITWLLDDAMNCDGYRFIFISHIPSDSAIRSYSDTQQVLQDIFVALKNKASIVVNGRTVDFANSTNEAICHITGHNHRDLSNVDNNFLSISTACDALYQDDGHGGVAGTVNEQAFDVFCIDYDSGTIKAVRVGRGSDRTWTY